MKECVVIDMLLDETAEREMRGVTVDGYVSYHVETKYGEDADGGRGTRKVFVDDVCCIEALDDITGDSVALTAAEEQYAKEKIVEKFLTQ